MEKYPLNLPFSPLQGLTRTASFSELPTANRHIIVKECDSTGGLVKQYSYEQVFIKDTNNIKKIQYSSLVTAESKQNPSLNIWKKNIPQYNSASNLAWPPKNLSPHTSTMDLNALNSRNSLLKKEDSSCGDSIYDDACECSDISLNKLKISDCEPLVTNTKKIKPSHFDSFNNPTPRFSWVLTESGFIDHTNNIKKESEKLDASTTSLLEDNMKHKSQLVSRMKPRERQLPDDISEERQVPDDNSSSTLNKRQFVFVLLLSLVISWLSILTFDLNQKPFDFTNASLELEKKMFGQEEAIKQISDHFQYNNDKFSVVVLVGGSGVGKTYTKKIIKKHFTSAENIFEYNPPLQEYIQPAWKDLSTVQCNFIVLENLKTDDLNDLINFTKFLYTLKDRPCITILAIINPQLINDYLIRHVDVDKSIKDIENLFSQENVPVKVIGFKHLPQEIIDVCIENEAKKSNVELTQEQFEEVRKSLVTANTGCKGAYAKVQLYANL